MDNVSTLIKLYVMTLMAGIVALLAFCVVDLLTGHAAFCKVFSEFNLLEVLRLIGLTLLFILYVAINTIYFARAHAYKQSMLIQIEDLGKIDTTKYIS